MLSMRSQFTVIAAVASLLWLPPRCRAQDSRVQEQIKVKAPSEPPAAFPQSEAGQAVVTYQNGELTIEANNASLIDVLRAVCKQIGAELDSQAVDDERIFSVLGPGPVREVLTALLNNSQFDYAMAESPNDPNTLASVVVFAKTKGSTQQVAGDPGAQNRVTQAQVSSTNPRASSIEMNSSLKQMKELLATARAEVAGGAVIETQGEAGMVGADAATILGQVEAQLNAIGDAAATDGNSAQIGQQAAAAPENPVGRPRHRRH